MSTKLRALPDDWPELFPLVRSYPAPFDTSLLPEKLRRYIDSVAAAKQVPPELVFMFVLGVIAVAVQGKGRVRLKSDYAEPINVYVMGELDPANRKSAVRGAVCVPIERYEAEQAELLRADHLRACDQRDVLEAKLKKAKLDAARAKGDAQREAYHEVVRLRDKLETMIVPALPRLLTEEATAESIVEIASENNGRVAILAAELTALENVAGRYNEGRANLGFLKSAWTGDESVRVDRKGSGSIRIMSPTATIVLAVQPAALRGLANRDQFRGEGMFGRFLLFQPESFIGQRATGLSAPELDQDAARDFNEMIDQLLRLKPARVDPRTGQWFPHEITLETDAMKAWSRLEAEVEALMAVGSALEGMRDWGGKLSGNTVRLAALLQLASIADHPDPFSVPLSSIRLEQAALIAHRYLVPHARAVYGSMNADPVVEFALYLLDRLLYLRDRGFPLTKRELHRASQGRSEISSVDDLQPGLELLIRHNNIRIVTPERSKSGGRPSERIELHPWLSDAR